MTLKAWTNISGTTAPSFTIGKDGVTIHNGTASPDASLGVAGDLYVRHGASTGLFQKEDSGWKVTNFSFIRQEVARGSSAQISDLTTYLAVIAGGSGTTNLVLPTGLTGKQITIKDEAGFGAVEISGATVDGAASYTISQAKGSVTLVWVSGGWRIIRAI